ncbi:hypothetical protein V8F33_013074 [Rhypophila sp. PSN 637]
MHPPSIPPPPPPPPPLNIPPSRARLQLAARLAMNKRNAAAAANGGEEGTSTTSENPTGSGTFSLPSTSASDRLRNPFADDDDDDEGDDHRQELGSGSGSGSDDDEAENGGRDSGSGWNRGSWWRGVVRTARRGTGRTDTEKEPERFGDGRDDDTDSEDDAVDDDIEDEEFGDFAMPEANQGSSTGMVTGIDPSRERLLLKPLPVHPSPGGAGKLSSAASPFTSLWPFSTTVKDTTAAPPSHTEQQPTSSEKSSPGGDATESTAISDEPVDLADMRADDDEGAAVVVGEDGQKINRAVEATRRTSIEDPDDGGEEIVVGRPSGTAAAR